MTDGYEAPGWREQCHPNISCIRRCVFWLPQGSIYDWLGGGAGARICELEAALGIRLHIKDFNGVMLPPRVEKELNAPAAVCVDRGSIRTGSSFYDDYSLETETFLEKAPGDHTCLTTALRSMGVISSYPAGWAADGPHAYTAVVFF